MTLNKSSAQRPSSSSCPVGVGLRPVHYPHLLTRPKTEARWFEAISENYMDSEGRPLAVLESIRRDYPLALHGVSMSIGAAEGLRPGYLKKLKALVDRVEPFIVSDHLCWTGTKASNTHDLLPLPYTEEALTLVAARVDQVQTALGRRIALENVSSYLTYGESSFAEWDFLVALARRSGCRLLLDVNNVHVNARNHRFDAAAYLDAIPADLVAQFHLAGFTDMGTYLFDTHSRPVSEEVWTLFDRVVARMPEVPILIEWDEEIPPFEELEGQARLARQVWERHHGRNGAGRPAEAAGARDRR